MASEYRKGEQLRLFNPDDCPSPDDGKPIYEHVDLFADEECTEPVVLPGQLSLF